MDDSLSLDGKAICGEIKKRARALGISVIDVCREAGVSIHTYKSWRSKRRDPSNASLKRIDAVLERREALLTSQEAVMKS